MQPTDEAELMEQAGVAVAVVEGSPLNIKLTTKADLQLGPGHLENRIGQLVSSLTRRVPNSA